MKYNQNRRIFRMFYVVTASVTLLTGFTSLAAEKDMPVKQKSVEVHNETEVTWNFTEIVNEVHTDALDEMKAAAEAAQEAYIKKVEEEKRAAEAATKLAAKKAAQEAGAEALWVLQDDTVAYTDGYLAYSKNYGGAALN